MGSNVSGDNSLRVGTGNEVSGDRSGAIGDPNTISGNDSYAMGNDNTIAANKSFVLGNNVTIASSASDMSKANGATFQGSVALGDSSTVAAARVGTGSRCGWSCWWVRGDMAALSAVAALLGSSP